MSTSKQHTEPSTGTMTNDQIAATHFAKGMELLGFDMKREGLVDTPDRLVRYLKEFSGNKVLPKLTTFKSSGARAGMIVEVGIPVNSLCEHHLAPFFGYATVGYLPDERVVGLSKLVRIVNHFSHRLQIQENLTAQIADCVMRELSATGVGVIIRAQHTCMSVRGVRAHGVETVTTEVRGSFKDASVKSEFLFHHGYRKV
jgi:GTP cyclohydrolase I